jgi:arsenite-transporting ATPase
VKKTGARRRPTNSSSTKAPRGKRPSKQPRSSSENPSPTNSLPSTRYLFFGGKGGTGKTTAASAAALLLLQHASAGEGILLFSTDPAHSLSDSLGVEIGDRLVEVARRGAARLFAREMNATEALDEFKRRHHGVLKEIADRGTLLDEADINELLNLGLPGMDEVMALFELSEIDRAAEYARIVVDTAPSGHTSRLLRLPEVFARWINALDRMSEKHRYMVAQFARGRRLRTDEVELFLRELRERVERVRAMLFDRSAASFTLVTIPEALGVEETARYLALLRKEGVPVTDLIVNRVERERGECLYCRARARGQSRWLERIERDFDSLKLRRVPLLSAEVRGLASLRRFARLAWEDGEEETDDGVRKRATPARASKRASKRETATGEQEAGEPFQLEPRRLLIFGGKGGVGKTTAAVSTALALAEHESASRVLVFSTDPAHSLSDSFGEHVGELKRGVASVGNLDAMEIDPASHFEALKERYRSWTDELFESLTGGSRWEVQFDREAMRELVALAPPGIDEIAALSRISDLLEDGSYTTIVLDTAPTGHLVRFLELPEVALSWVHTFIKLLLKYKNVVRWGGVAEELVALSKSIKRVSALLTDAEACEFTGVAIAERMSLEETLRLSETLARLKVPMRRLLVNNLIPLDAARECDFCAARRRSQGAALREFQSRIDASVKIYFAPQQPHEIQGAVHLREHFAHWRRLEYFV